MSYPDYTSLPQYANILHLWKLDEESGTRSDFIATCHLTDNNTVLYGTGKIGNGADFESDSSEYLSATSDSSSDMDFTDSNFTISFWVKPESLPKMRFLWKQTTDKGWFITFSEAEGKIVMNIYQTGALQQVISNISFLNIGTLTHITVVRNGNTGYIYKNGVDDTLSSDTLINPVASGQPLYIGSNPTPIEFLDGIMDELIVWDVALSPAEVSTLYNWYSKAGFSGAISFSGDLITKTAKTLTGAISFVGDLNTKAKKFLEGAITFVGTLTYKQLFQKLLTGSISFIGTLQKLPKKVLTGNISFSGTLSTKVKKTLTGAISFIGQIFSPYWDGIWSLFIKRTTTWTRERTDIYSFDFSFDDGNWTLSDATISGGVLDITADEGYGNREPDAGWLSGANDDFTIEIDFKQDSTVNYGAEITLILAGDVKWIYFDIQGSANLMEIWYNGTKASQSFVDDTNWHTMKVRRVGTTYYMSVDSGDEISWDYGTARTLEDIKLSMYGCTGDFDNFKYYGLEAVSWTAQDKEDTDWTTT